MIWGAVLSAMAGDTVLGETFVAASAFVVEHPRAKGELVLILSDSPLTCDEARRFHTLEVRQKLMAEQARLVVANFRSSKVGAVAREVAVMKGLRTAIGPSATLEALPTVAGPGGRARLDVTALEADGTVGARLALTTPFHLCDVVNDAPLP